MKDFNKFVEAIFITTQPQSDTAGAVEPSCPCQQKDMFTKSTDSFMDTLNTDNDQEIQPDDNVGETGEIQADGETSDVELECMGEQGLKVKYNGMEILLPRNVVDQIKGFEAVEKAEEGESEAETEEGEDAEAPVENEESDEETEKEEDSNDDITESKKPAFWLKKGKDGKDKESDDCKCKGKKSKKSKKFNFQK